jgi:type II secretory pathway component PulK
MSCEKGAVNRHRSCCEWVVWGAEQEAREQLMAQVLDERRIQVRECEWEPPML